MSQIPSHNGVAVVTGAMGGIGSAIATRLAADGYTVAALDCVDHNISPNENNSVVPFFVDVSDYSKVESCIRNIELQLGSIQVLVNSAGILRPAKLTEITSTDWKETLSVNTTGVLNLLQCVVPLMAHRRSGSVVTVASNAAHTPRIGLGSYAASKAAAEMLTRCIGLEYAHQNIRFNCVCPGSTDTSMLTTLSGPDAAQSSVNGNSNSYRLGIPLGRIASASDIANVVAFLVSDEARHITLENITVDGGATLGTR